MPFNRQAPRWLDVSSALTLKYLGEPILRIGYIAYWILERNGQYHYFVADLYERGNIEDFLNIGRSSLSNVP